MCYMLCFPHASVQGATCGLLLWYRQVLPALLPFSIISYIFIESNYLTTFCKKIHGYTRKILPISSTGIYPFVTGFLFGFPLGSKIVGQLYEKQQLSQKEAQLLLSVSNNISPVFIMNYIVDENIGIHAFVIPALVCIYLPPIIYAMILSRIRPCNNHNIKNQAPRSQITFKIIDAGIMNGFETMLKLCGYIVIFSILCTCYQLTPAILSPIMLIGSSILEITNGISLICTNIHLPIYRFLLCNTLTAFGGLCSIAQTNAMISHTNLSVQKYILDKLFFTFCTFILSCCYLFLIY